MTAQREPVGAPPTGGPSWRDGRLAHARPWGRHATELAAGTGLLGVGWLLLSDNTTVPRWEVEVFHQINDLPDALRWPLWPVMQLGNFWMWIGGAGIAYALTRRWRPTAAAASAVLLGWAAAKVVKHLVDRGRPGDLLEGVDIREAGLHGHGFVSGHTVVAFALATVLTPLVPGRWRYVPYTLATLVGFARIYYGAHLPLDVIGGAGLGILCGLVSALVFGTIHPVAKRPAP